MKRIFLIIFFIITGLSTTWNLRAEDQVCVEKECGWDSVLCGTCDYKSGFYCNLWEMECVKVSKVEPFADRSAIEERFTETGDDQLVVHDKYTNLQWTKTSWNLFKEYSQENSCNITYGGYTDWRRPTKTELETLMNYWKESAPYSDFPEIESREFITSSECDSYYMDYNCTGKTFTVNFLNRNIFTVEENEEMKLKCVRGETEEISGYRYDQKIFNNQIIIYDLKTGLEWTKKSVEGLTVSEAVKYCEDLNYGNQEDWYLPDVYEMVTLIGEGRILFPMINRRPYWVYNQETELSLKVDFEYGWVNKVNNTSEVYTMCVRK